MASRVLRLNRTLNPKPRCRAYNRIRDVLGPRRSGGCGGAYCPCLVQHLRRLRALVWRELGRLRVSGLGKLILDFWEHKALGVAGDFTESKRFELLGVLWV